MIKLKIRDIFGAAAAALVVCLTVTACKKSEQANSQNTPAKEKSELPGAANSTATETAPRATRRASTSAPHEVTPPDKRPAAKAKSPPEIVNDPSAIAMEDGFSQPKVGDKIYNWHNLPEDACGEYWVKSSNGKVSKVAVCRDQH